MTEPQNITKEPKSRKEKTYLSPEVQWNRTVSVFMEDFSYEFVPDKGKTWNLGEAGLTLGQIIQPNRVYMPGDVVLVLLWNGAAERLPTWGMSSKGHRGRHLYLKHGAHSWEDHSKSRAYSSGPLRLVELPGSVLGQPLRSPVVQHFVLETLRAGEAVGRVSTNNPTLLHFQDDPGFARWSRIWAGADLPKKE